MAIRFAWPRLRLDTALRALISALNNRLSMVQAAIDDMGATWEGLGGQTSFRIVPTTSLLRTVSGGAFTATGRYIVVDLSSSPLPTGVPLPEGVIFDVKVTVEFAPPDAVGNQAQTDQLVLTGRTVTAPNAASAEVDVGCILAFFSTEPGVVRATVTQEVWGYYRGVVVCHDRNLLKWYAKKL